MSTRIFTVQEANALLAEIEPLLGDLLARRARVARATREMPHIIGGTRSDVGSREASQVAADMAAIEALIEQIEGHGVRLKDINIGLVDFLAERRGREVWLCWRYGEDSVTHFHELHLGFRARRPIDW